MAKGLTLCMADVSKDLYPNEDKDTIRNAVRSAAKGVGIVDTPENLWSFYISRVRI